MSSAANFRSVLMVFLLLSFALVANVQAKPEHGKKFKDWTVVCEELPKLKQTVCNIFQNVTNEDGKVVMQVVVGYPPNSTSAQALVTLPLGVLLPPGLEFNGGDAEAVRVPYGVCVQNGCIAIIKMSDEIIKGMKSGSKGSIKFAAAKQKIIEIPISLSGFTAAFNSLK